MTNDRSFSQPHPALITGTLSPGFKEQTHLKVLEVQKSLAWTTLNRQNWKWAAPVQIHFACSRLPYFGLVPRGAPAIDG